MIDFNTTTTLMRSKWRGTGSKWLRFAPASIGRSCQEEESEGPLRINFSIRQAEAVLSAVAAGRVQAAVAFLRLAHVLPALNGMRQRRPLLAVTSAPAFILMHINHCCMSI